MASYTLWWCSKRTLFDTNCAIEILFTKSGEIMIQYHPGNGKRFCCGSFDHSLGSVTNGRSGIAVRLLSDGRPSWEMSQTVHFLQVCFCWLVGLPIGRRCSMVILASRYHGVFQDTGRWINTPSALQSQVTYSYQSEFNRASQWWAVDIQFPLAVILSWE